MWYGLENFQEPETFEYSSYTSCHDKKTLPSLTEFLFCFFPITLMGLIQVGFGRGGENGSIPPLHAGGCSYLEPGAPLAHLYRRQQSANSEN